MEKTKEKEKACPFNPELSCEDCRLYQKMDMRGSFCVFQSILWTLTDVSSGK